MSANLQTPRKSPPAKRHVGRALASRDDVLPAGKLVNDGVDGAAPGDGHSRPPESPAVLPEVVRWQIDIIKTFSEGKIVDEMKLNIDLAPTFLDLAGVPAPREMQGVSWKALAAGQKPANWRQSFLAEYFYENGGGDTPAPVGVRAVNTKIVKYFGHAEWTEVFDLAVDPYELMNLAADPAATAKLSAEFDAQVKAGSDAEPPGRGQTPPIRRQGAEIDRSYEFQAHYEPGTKR